MDLFELNGRVVVNLADAVKAFNEISNEGKKTESKMSKFFSGVGKAAATCGKAIATGLAAGATAMGALTVKALNLSGELEQNMGGSEAVFGEYANKMQETAKSAFENMGLSASDFLGTANKMGALFQGAGFDIETSSTMASDAMQRAADVASIMGIDTESAMEAIAGAAKGNFTMMDNLGVAMNDTTLQAYAMSKGINKSTSEMTNQEKIGLAMEMFMEKTAYAAGNYAKENQTLAGSLGTAKAALTNFLDGSGDVDSLVSSFSNAANVIVENLKTLAPRLINGMTEIVNQVVPMIGPLLQELLPVIVEGAVSLVNGVVQALPTVISALMDALPALIEGVMQIVQGLLTALPQIVDMLISALPGLVQMIADQLPALTYLLIDAFIQMFISLCNNLAQIIMPLIEALPSMIVSIVEALMNNLPALIEGLITLVLGIVEALPQIIQALIDATPKIIEMVITALLNAVPQLIAGAIKLVFGIVTALPQILASLITALPKAFVGIWNGVKNVFSGAGEWFGKIFTGAKDNIGKAFSNVKDVLSKPFTAARDAIKGVANKIFGFFKGKIEMPKIKLPHFGIKPKGWKIGDLLKGSIPKLGIDWYAEGGIMTQPTLFDYNPTTGRAKVGGEAGDEAIAPIETLRQYVREEVRSETIGIVQILDRIVNMLAQFFPDALEAMNQVMVLDDGTLVAKTAPAMDVELGKIAIKKGRGR